MFILSFILLGSIHSVTVAQTPTESDAANKIEDLKERLATKVAELRQSVPKAIYGTVTDTSVSTITVDAQTKAMKIELTDDIQVAQILKGKRTKLDAEDIDKKDIVSVFGDYDSTIDILKATKIFIEAATKPVRIHGTIEAVDRKKNTFEIKGVDGQKYTIDVEKSTDTSLWTKEDGIDESGFSKLEEGMFVSILGTPEKNNESFYTANRILALTIPGSETPTPTPEEESTPSATPKPTTADEEG